MGVLLAFFAISNKYFSKETLITLLFYSLFLHVLYIDLVALYEFIETGKLLKRYGGLTQSPVLANYITNLLSSMLIVEFIYRSRVQKKIIKSSSLVLFIVLVLCILSSIIEGMRLGVISLFFMSITGVIFFVISNNNFGVKIKSIMGLSLLIICILPLLYTAKYDERWSSLIETIPIAMNSDNNTYWQTTLEADIPKLANGEKVSPSNYLRMKWIIKGAQYIAKDIYGIGYGRNIFGHAIEKYESSSSLGISAAKKRSMKGAGNFTGNGEVTLRGWHSHSSIIDFTIGVGLIGLVIWILFIGKIILSSTSIFIKTGNYFALLSIFVTSGFIIRSMVDSNMRDHMFKQFFLILGISVALTFYELKKKQKKI